MSLLKYQDKQKFRANFDSVFGKRKSKYAALDEEIVPKRVKRFGGDKRTVLKKYK